MRSEKRQAAHRKRDGEALGEGLEHQLQSVSVNGQVKPILFTVSPDTALLQSGEGKFFWIFLTVLSKKGSESGG
ncbi:MAG: hypothetical protein KJ936_04815 [Proteobacteria bacterium]|nr:hypothetical protein [Pseudomonadota bacterium]MBU2226976.1 hypothetical protein [Pseudomonadota bacterium]MBU2261522.1 hypothetical protein [Pseudomonadota bacterium]